MMTMLLPIPGKKNTLSLFFLPYDIKQGYVNYSARILVRNTDTLDTLRDILQEQHKVAKASFSITKVDKNEFTRYFNCLSQVEVLQNDYDGKIILCYEIDPKLNPTFEGKLLDKKDSNNGVSEDYTRLIVEMAKFEKQ